MELLTVDETARLLKVAPITVRRFIQSGRLPAIKVGKGIRVRKEAVEQFLAPVGSKTGRPFADSSPAEHQAREVNPAMERIRPLPPTPEQLARRQAIVADTLEARKKFVITPKTTTELVHEVRQEEEESYGRPGH